jgi:NAD(P)H-hydrate epimerase
LEKIPEVSVEQMREIDKIMIEEFNICLLQMMENAGRNLAVFIRKKYPDLNKSGCSCWKRK